MAKTKTATPLEQHEEICALRFQQIEDRLQPQFDASLGGTPTPDVSLQPNMQVPLQANVRNQLALGTLDDALATQMFNRGIGTL